MTALFVARGRDGSGSHPAKHPERVEHPEAVFPDIDPGAEDAQFVVLLVYPNPPALAREGKAGGDIEALKRMTSLSRDETIADSWRMDEMFRTVDECACAVVAT